MKLRILALASLLAPGLGAYAQVAQPLPSPVASAPISSVNLLRVSEMMGDKVLGAQKKEVGEIKDLIVDLTTGDVRYALLEFDPGFFKSEKFFAVPANALGWDGVSKNMTYRDVSREQLMRASVEKNDWTRAVNNRRYVDGLDENYGFKPPAGTMHSIRASTVMSREVDSRAGKDIGKIKDLVFDMKTAKIQYVVFSFDPSWFSSAKLFAFPLTAFTTNDKSDNLTLDVDKSMLTSMKNFDADKWGSLNDLNRDAFINPVPRTSTTQ
jgi:sporulation protein YlmC with PRC-barrel domain